MFPTVRIVRRSAVHAHLDAQIDHHCANPGASRSNSRGVSCSWTSTNWWTRSDRARTVLWSWLTRRRTRRTTLWRFCPRESCWEEPDWLDAGRRRVFPRWTESIGRLQCWRRWGGSGWIIWWWNNNKSSFLVGPPECCETRRSAGRSDRRQFVFGVWIGQGGGGA